MKSDVFGKRLVRRVFYTKKTAACWGSDESLVVEGRVGVGWGF